MGYFHKGHLSLMRQARKECDLVVISIYVNPLQFGPKEDFKKYPRDMKRDKKTAQEAGVDYIFAPDDKEIYHSGYSTYVDVEGTLTSGLCGAFRPGHFKGVTTVCAKLFQIVQPDIAYFGQKDAQQAVVIKRMVEDLNMPLKIKVCPTIREKDGLAMSSRNVYLSAKQRKASLILSRSLFLAEKMIKKENVLEAKKIKGKIKQLMQSEPLVNLEYIAVCDILNLEEIAKIKDGTLIALAARLGKTRLIDNIIIDLEA